MKTPRLLPALVVLSLAALLCPGRPARAQGQWYPGYVPCYADGTPVPPAMTDGNGFEVMAGTLTGRPAGGQSIPYAQYGRYLYSFNPNSPSVPDPFPYDPLADSSIPGLWVSSRNGLLSSDGPDVSVTSGASGQVQVSLHAYFLWRPGYDCDNPPSGPPPPPPPTASFLLQTQLSASYSASYQRQPFASGPDPTAGISAQAQVQDGYGELAQVIAPAPPYPYSYGSHGVSGTAPAGGLHLVTVGVQTVGGKGIYTINLSGSAQAQAANSLNGANFVGEASATATLNGGARHDDRAVTISAGVDVTNMKTTLFIAPDAVSVDVNGDENYLPTPNQRGLDGTMYGDTIYSYNTHQDGSLYNPPNTNWITFQPNFRGNWHWKAAQDHLGDTVLAPNVVNPNTWSWSPNESQDNWDYGLCSMPMATNYALINGYPKGQDAPTTYPVVYTATDNSDRATAGARYVMTLHDPYEKNFPDHTQDMTDDANEKQLGIYGPQAPFDGSTISASVTTENPWSVKVKASGEIPLPWIGGALGVDVEKSVTDDDKIGASCSDNHTHAGDYSWVEAVDHYIYHHGKVDTWGVNGYKGTQPYEVWEVGTPAHFLRLHTPYKNATPGPSPHP